MWPISTSLNFKRGWNGAYSSPQQSPTKNPKSRHSRKDKQGKMNILTLSSLYIRIRTPNSWHLLTHRFKMRCPPGLLNLNMWPGKVKEKDMFLTWTRFTRIFMFNWGELLEALHVDFGSASEVFSPAERPGTGGSGGNGATEDLREPERAETWSLQLRGLQGQSSELRKLPCEMLGGYRKLKFFVWITLSGRWWFFPGGFRWFWGSWEL